MDFGERPVLLGHSATLDAKPRRLDQGDPTTSAGMASLRKRPAPLMLTPIITSPGLTSPTNSGTSLKSTISADWDFLTNEPLSVGEDAGNEQSDSLVFDKKLSLPAGGKKTPNFHASVKIPDTFRPKSDAAGDKQLGSKVFGKKSLPSPKTAKTCALFEFPCSVQFDLEDEWSDSVALCKNLSLPAGGKKTARTRLRVKTPGAGNLQPDCEVMESDFMAFAKSLSLQAGSKLSVPANRKHSRAKTPAGSSELRDFSAARHWSKDSKDINGLNAKTCGAERPARIFVKLPCGKLLAVDAELSQSVTSFKQQLLSSFAAEFGEGDFVLWFRKKRLPSNLSLKQQGVELGNVVHASRVIARAPPGVGTKTFRQRAYFINT